MNSYERTRQRRELRAQRSNSGFAAVFFGAAAFVFFAATGGIGWMFGSDGEVFWWISFVIFCVCVSSARAWRCTTTPWPGTT